MVLLFLALCPKSKQPFKIESQDTDTDLKIQQLIFIHIIGYIYLTVSKHFRSAAPLRKQGNVLVLKICSKFYLRKTWKNELIILLVKSQVNLIKNIITSTQRKLQNYFRHT